MTVYDDRVPFVQQDGLPRPDTAHSGTTVEPKLHEALVQKQGHKVASQVVPLAAEQDDAIEGLGTEFEAQLDMFVGAMEGRKG